MTPEKFRRIDLAGEQLRSGAGCTVGVDPRLVRLRRVAVDVAGPVFPARQIDLKRADAEIAGAEFTRRGDVPHRVPAAAAGAGVGVGAVDQLRVVDRTVVRLEHAIDGRALVKLARLDLGMEDAGLGVPDRLVLAVPAAVR